MTIQPFYTCDVAQVGPFDLFDALTLTHSDLLEMIQSSVQTRNQWTNKVIASFLQHTMTFLSLKMIF